MNTLTHCLITASSPGQAKVFDALIRRRLDAGLYPREIDFRVYSDPPGGRVGSGGGTLLALRSLVNDCSGGDPAAFLRSHRILIVHAGGESRRMPCFAPEGKIFAPIPVTTSSIIPPVVLDMHLSLFLKYPWREGEVVVASGDVIVDFDTALVPDNRGDVCGFSTPASLEQGSRHGVFKFDRHHKEVVDFFQKGAPDFLARNALLEGTTDCALDMGTVALSPAAAGAFLRLADEKLTEGKSIGDAVAGGKIAFDLYLEVMSACLNGLSFDEFRARAPKIVPVLARPLFDLFHGFGLSGVVTSSTTFLHVGALGELLPTCAELHNRGLKPFYAQYGDELEVSATPELVVYNSVNLNLPAGRHRPVLAESVRESTIERLMGDNLLFGLTAWSSDAVIPDGICIDERHVDGAVYHLVYSINDQFKPQRKLDGVVFCGTAMPEWLRQHGLTEGDLWEGTGEFDLLSARLFMAGPDDLFVAGYWQPPGAEWTGAFKAAKRCSIRDINERDTAVGREQRRIDIRKRLLADRLRQGAGWRNISLPDFAEVARDPGLVAVLRTTLQETDDELLAEYRRRLLDGIGAMAGEDVGGTVFEVDYVGERTRSAPLCAGVKEDQIVWARSPIRMDLAGGWSDTPPYTLRHGGQVVNVAADLNGQPPIQVFCRRTVERRVRIHSIDLGVTETVTEFPALLDYRDPTSPFGLPKVALCLLGLTPENHPGRSLSEYLAELGFGLEITLLCAVPKGSGLGTSSILGAAILAGLHRFFGQPYAHDELFRQVLQMEQMLTTGGGWQDQIGGVEGGVKYIECKAGLRPAPVIHRLDPFLFENAKTHGCFTLFYTGITRLAKNILREVVAQVNANTPAYLFTLHGVRRLALQAREAIGLRSLPMISRVLSDSWAANKLIHHSSTNEDVDALLAGTREHYCGVKLLGAGGGGYALFASESVAQADELREVLRARFENRKARIVEFSLNGEGLQVTVS